MKKYYTHGIWVEEGHTVGPPMLVEEQRLGQLQGVLVASGDERVVALALAALDP